MNLFAKAGIRAGKRMQDAPRKKAHRKNAHHEWRNGESQDRTAKEPPCLRAIRRERPDEWSYDFDMMYSAVSSTCY